MFKNGYTFRAAQHGGGWGDPPPHEYQLLKRQPDFSWINFTTTNNTETPQPITTHYSPTLNQPLTSTTLYKVLEKFIKDYEHN